MGANWTVIDIDAPGIKENLPAPEVTKKGGPGGLTEPFTDALPAFLRLKEPFAGAFTVPKLMDFGEATSFPNGAFAFADALI